MITRAQEQGFAATIISGSLLEEAIEWIRDNLSPEDVFGESDLQEWADGSGYVPDVG